uniref:Uncharacterized protein n=1 Tax=Anguilla anguilla TaxID=7936 RepID=A0A0E9W168_ANGAN
MTLTQRGGWDTPPSNHRRHRTGIQDTPLSDRGPALHTTSFSMFP